MRLRYNRKKRMQQHFVQENEGGAAASAYEKAIEQDPKYYPKAYLRLGQLYARARNVTESQNALLKAIQMGRILSDDALDKRGRRDDNRRRACSALQNE